MPADYPTFIAAKAFSEDWEAAGLGDTDMRRLQVEIGSDPTAGAVMSGTGGLRKVRFARPGGGKSGGVRVCYAHFPNYGVVQLYAVFRKNEKANLSKAERAAVAAELVGIEAQLAEAKAAQDAANERGGEWARKEGY